MKSRRWIRAIALAVACVSTGALAKSLPKPEYRNAAQRGHELAVARCSACHAVEQSDESPTEINANTAFRNLHQRFPVPMLLEALTTNYISGHDEMPGFAFSHDEIEDLLTYLDSFAPADKRYLPQRW